MNCTPVKRKAGPCAREIRRTTRRMRGFPRFFPFVAGRYVSPVGNADAPLSPTRSCGYADGDPPAMSQLPSSNRRDFLRASLATSAIFGAESALTTRSTRAAQSNAGGAKNVIFMVSDGMNHGALSLARQFLETAGAGTTHWTRLYREQPVVRALVETFSANSCVTDSAAAASAWGGGKRVNNGVLNVLPEGGHVRTLHEKIQAKGRKTGLVTTATITHATPAGFAVNIDSRADEAVIAEQYLKRRVDLLLGGGRKFFSDDLRKRYAAAGYAVVDSRDALTNCH